MDDEHRLISRLLSRAAAKVGSPERLAIHIQASPAEVWSYMQGKKIPPEAVLLRAVEVILDELPNFRTEFSPEVWHSLSLPKGS